MIADLAAGQHGVVTRKQLLGLGLRPGQIRHRLAVGRLHPVHHGVYAAGHRRVSGTARWMAAVLACGRGAVLSHRTAAAMWALLPYASSLIHVTTTVRGSHAPRGVRLHRCRSLHPEDRAIHDGIPVTSVARTLADLAEVIERSKLERALEAAERLRLFDLAAFHRLCERTRGRRGPAALRAVLTDVAEPVVTRSELERRFLELCASEGLPQPAVNVVVAGCEVDAVWRDARLVVELDGFEHHGTRPAFERDRARDLNLQVAGHRVVRLTSRRLSREPRETADALRALLGHGAIE